MTSWIKNRMKERTSWDGAVCIALGLMILFMAPLAKIAAGLAIAWGAWTIWKSEWVVVVEKEVKKNYFFYQWQYSLQYLVSYCY